jgi:hypothetical protein
MRWQLCQMGAEHDWGRKTGAARQEETRWHACLNLHQTRWASAEALPQVHTPQLHLLLVSPKCEGQGPAITWGRAVPGERSMARTLSEHATTRESNGGQSIPAVSQQDPQEVG